MTRTRRFLFVLGVILLLAVVFRTWLLRGIGGLLVHDDGPAPADIAVVLAGDSYGNRITRAAELARKGLVPRVLVSGPAGMYGFHESELAVNFAVQKGYPREWFIPFPLQATSTLEEARAIVPELRRRGVKRFLLVTSNYHSGRAGRIFARLARDLDMRVVAAPDQQFRVADWWQSRDGRKQCFFEWSKTVADCLGL